MTHLTLQRASPQSKTIRLRCSLLSLQHCQVQQRAMHQHKYKVGPLFESDATRLNTLLTTQSSGAASGLRNGTCFTSNECSSKGGSSSGSCAAGFGVCCVFTSSTSGDTISQNCTYIQVRDAISPFCSPNTDQRIASEPRLSLDVIGHRLSHVHDRQVPVRRLLAATGL